MKAVVGRTLSVVVVAGALMLSACGASDDGAASDADDTAAPAVSEDVADTVDSEDTPDESSPPAETSPSDDPAESVAPEESSAEPVDDGSSAATSCDEIFTAAEIEELFAEPAELTEENDESLGSVMCTWETIEDENDTEDLAFKLLITQLFTGEPIPASNFIDPSIFETVTTIDGVGDLAYSTEGLGTDYYFLDEPVGGSLSYSEKDLGSDAPPLRTSEEIEALFRTFHDRVT